MDDEQLMARLMAGDEAALAALVVRHHSPLLGYLFRLCQGDRALAEDLVQESFIRVLRQVSYQAGRPFKPWLYAIATNLARDYFKSAAVRYTEATSPDDASLTGLCDIAPGPEELALSAEKGSEVAAALGQLGPEYRAAVVLRFYNGLSLQEIAQTLQIPLGTVKSRLSVGTHRLRDLLKPKVGLEII